MFNHISGVSGDAKHDVICCIYARLCSVMKLDTSRKIIVLKLINEEFAHAGLRNYALQGLVSFAIHIFTAVSWLQKF